MREQVVEFVSRSEAVSFHDVPGVFQVRPERPLLWLQRACVWVLRKLGAHARDRTVAVTRHVIRGDVFMERLFKQKRVLSEQFYCRPTELLIGAEDYEEMMGAPDIPHSFRFAAQYIGASEGAPYGKVLGLTVRVIPWMRGVVMLPQDDRRARAA